jgi:D-serine deaminase-like pyridoxal phosphate-dependent protein
MTLATEAASIVGRSIEEADTPALWVDLEALDHNIAVMAGRAAEAGVDWRPHVKASKSPDLARRLIAGGAVGITCAKVSEADVMANGRVDDILIANEIIGPTKIARLVEVASKARVCVAVDDASNLREIAEAATAAGVNVDVLVDVNVGLNRCGVTPEEAPALAQLALDLAGVSLRGLMGYEGHVMGIPDLEEKEAASQASADVLAEAKELVEAAGIEVPVRSGAGTGNYWIAARLGSLTEIQSGGGVLLDVSYAESMKVPDHRPALFVQAQVISTAQPGRAIGDAGWKTTGRHTGLPRVIAPSGVTCVGLNAEHTVLELDEGVTVTAGQRFTMIPHYSDSTVLLHRQLYAVRDGIVEAVWDVAGAGMLQ